MWLSKNTQVRAKLRTLLCTESYWFVERAQAKCSYKGVAILAKNFWYSMDRAVELNLGYNGSHDKRGITKHSR